MHYYLPETNRLAKHHTLATTFTQGTDPSYRRRPASPRYNQLQQSQPKSCNAQPATTEGLCFALPRGLCFAPELCPTPQWSLPCRGMPNLSIVVITLLSPRTTQPCDQCTHAD